MLIFITSVSQGFAQAPADVVNPYSSVYRTKLEDPLAVCFTPELFNIKADGTVDVSDALQEAINKVQETVRYGIVFIPEGTYRISKTIYLWKGVRLIGYGKKRPRIILPENTSGFQDGEKKYLFHFCSDRPWRNQARIQDANAGTFYSGIRNIDINIEEGNPLAVGVRFHAAQHCFLSHMDFHLSAGNTGVEDICNEIEFCRFYNGDYAIDTRKTAPGWQAIVLDSYFEKQTIAAIQTEEVGLTLIRDQFKNVPTVVSVKEDRSEQLWISDSKFENITRSAIIVGNENSPKTQINLQNIICTKVPDFLSFRTSRKTINASGEIYKVDDLTHGLQYSGLETDPATQTTHHMTPLKKAPELQSSDVPMLPPTNMWVNLKSLGAKGDGIHDDTEILKQAIKNHATIYLPGGHYRVTESIVLKPETNLVGLHPSITHIVLKDSTPDFQGIGAPLPLLETPRNGINIVTGIGLNTSGVNPRAVAAKWMAGTKSMMNDVRFTGGHGTYDLSGKDVRVYNDNRTADGISYRKWDTQYWSLWITGGGGGTFKDIWTPSPYASAGMFISNTATEGRIYYMSSEHHVRNEIILDKVSNWKIFGLQLEEESGEGPYCLPLEIKNSGNILFANTFSYRVSRVTTPFPDAIRTGNSSGIVFRGLRTWTWTKFLFDNTLTDVTSNRNIRAREIALLNITEQKQDKQESRVEKLAGGFDFIDGAAVDAEGNIYFVDSRWNRIYCWNVKDERLNTVCELPIFPVSLAFDTQGNLLVVSRFMRQATAFERGNIRALSMNPENPLETIAELPEVPIGSVDRVQLVINQSSRYRMEHHVASGITNPVQTCFLAKDGVTIVPNTPDIGQTFALKPVRPGESFYVSSSAAQKTFVCKVNEKGALTDPRLIAEDGESDVSAHNGDVYISSGNLLVYDQQGNFKKTIEIPERPSCIVRGGKDKNTLYICARSSLYRLLE
ncbi:MAG: gluconolaconase [Dysgonamonadaceae bacterium]|nr:gluconolaconase [Dysgonamonadaceae bacterium]